MNGYATDASEIVGVSSVLHNTLTIQNSCTNASLVCVCVCVSPCVRACVC